MRLSLDSGMENKMKLRYWGTAAAEGIPGAFCGCDVCTEAREKGGKYVRTRSQVLLDDCLLVDYGSDTYMNALRFGFDMSKLEHLMITHVHADHFYPAEFGMRGKNYAHNVSSEALVIHGSDEVRDAALKVDSIKAAVESGRLVFDVMEPFESRDICGFKITALPATHPTVKPYIYIFEKQGKTLLLHNDSGYLKPEVMEWLASSGIKFDFVSYECTFATRDATSKRTGETNHLGIPNILEERRRFIQNGNYKDSTRESITHFSHNTPTVGYGDMLGYADEHSFILAYDGLTIEI